MLFSDPKLKFIILFPLQLILFRFDSELIMERVFVDTSRSWIQCIRSMVLIFLYWNKSIFVHSKRSSNSFLQRHSLQKDNFIFLFCSPRFQRFTVATASRLKKCKGKAWPSSEKILHWRQSNLYTVFVFIAIVRIVVTNGINISQSNN